MTDGRTTIGAAACARPVITLFALALFALDCGAGSAVERGYDGYVTQGRYIAPDAYAAFLRGAIAEASGKSSEAIRAYTEAARADPDSPEVWTRIAALRCAASPLDARAPEALAEAMALGGDRAQAWTVKATCALSRGDTAGAQAAARRAAELDASADRANALLAKMAPGTEAVHAREALLALTITAADPVVAWDALASWAQDHGDVALWGFAFEGLVKAAPERRASAARAAEALARAGQVGVARAVAAAAADASIEPLAQDRALAARLAVDQAIATGDPARVRRRATRVRVTLGEAAARALLAGDAALARNLATSVAAADEGNVEASLVLAASNQRDRLATLPLARSGATPVSAAAWAVLQQALSDAVSPAEAQRALAGFAHDPIVSGDTLVQTAWKPAL